MDEDLPLLSNINEILVQHYIFSFNCDFKKKCFDSSVILFLVPVATQNIQTCNCSLSTVTIDSSEQLKGDFASCKNKLFISNQSFIPKEFILILDCHKMKVTGVKVVDLSLFEFESFRFVRCDPNSVNTKETLNYSVTDWSLKIWMAEKCCQFCFPKAIRISYQTLPSSPSLLWVRDQDRKPSVFTYGAAVNNRSLFPCQEPPVAMATWEATVIVSDSAVVLMSGDEEPLVSSHEEKTQFYYFTKKVLPLSTLCLAIGFWEGHPITQKNISSPKCGIYAPVSLMNLAIKELFEYVPYCLKISEDILGAYPFPRIDFLIVPPTFGSLGMASPNVVFLSQSLLVGNGSMVARVSHEIAHGWFGLLIGALDWTEEWLSEGFATFVEDYLHSWTMNMTEEQSREYIELKSFIRRKTLLDEVSNTENSLQVLRPSKGKEDKCVVDGVNATVLKNGQNPMKGFVQVHYIKGYFLLKYLADAVGIDDFFAFLRFYIEKYGGQLVTSSEFLTLYLNRFPSVSENISLESIYENWLHNPGIPEMLSRSNISPQNKLFIQVSEETEKWNKLNKSLHKKQVKRRKLSLEEFSILTSEQIIILLEYLLELDKISFYILECLNEVYKLKESNPEVQHRWFELVVKHEYKKEYAAVENFLTNHLAMGVYLYGEMIFSDDIILNKIAKNCYNSLESEMEPNYQRTIQQMLTDSAIE